MSKYVLLADYRDDQRTLGAGAIIDSASFNIASLTLGGAALVPYTSAMDAALTAFRAIRGSKPVSPQLIDGDLVAVLLAAGQIGGSGVGSAPSFVFANFGTQDTSQGRYTDWHDLMAALQQVQIGAAPTVKLALQGPFTVPLTGMPVNGWDLRGGRFGSYYGATGSVVIDFPAGAKLDNCFGIGLGVDPAGGSVVMKIAPPAGTGVCEWSALPLDAGAAPIFVIGGGCVVDHSTAPGALMRTANVAPGGGTNVLVVAGANQNVGLVPPLSGPLMELVGIDSAVCVQQMAPNGMPDSWLVGGGASSILLSIYDIAANPNTPNPAAWVPGFTGGGGVITPFPLQKSSLLNYVPSVLADWSGVAPTSVADALDRIAAKITPIP